MTVKVSIVIPVYNTKNYLSECLDSVLNQSLKEIEVVCIDDGSTDGSLELLRVYEARDERLSVLVQEHLGVSQARNKGLNAAKGEFVRFMDSDDWYPDMTTLEKMYKALKDSGALICGGSFSEYKDGILKTVFTHPFYQDYTFHEEGMIDFKDYQYDLAHVRYLFNTKMLRENNIYYPPYTRYEDPVFLLKAMVCAKRFYRVKDICYCYRQGHKPGVWSDENAVDQLTGIIDNLKLTRKCGLDKLHYFTVKRIENNYLNPIMENLRSGNKSLLQYLIIANGLIETSFMQKYESDYEAGYILEPIRRYILASKSTLEGLESELIDIRNSTSFKIGRIITLVPRKIRGFIYCLRDHGLNYTMRLMIKKISG